MESNKQLGIINALNEQIRSNIQHTTKENCELENRIKFIKNALAQTLIMKEKLKNECIQKNIIL